jgi:hypothetical protein
LFATCRRVALFPGHRGDRPIFRTPTLRPASRLDVTKRLGLLAVIAAGLLLLAGLMPAAAESTPDEVAEAVRGVYDSGRYQTEMPQEQVPIEFEPLKIPDLVKEIIRIVFYTLLIVGGLLLLFYLVTGLPSLREALRRRVAAADGASVGPLVSDADRGQLDIALAEADRLSRQGAHGEALHLLLLYCLGELRRRFGLGLPPALTSREILGLSALPEIRRTGLSIIVSAVEISHFGGRPVDEATYRSCRQRCEDVVLGGAAA